jgi:glutamate-1-semialdehyde 2,1-aminomutase
MPNILLDYYNSTHAKDISTFYGYAPKNILKGKGALLYDQQDKEYLDCTMALGSVSLGYAYDQVDDFVIKQISSGVNFSRPSFLEEQLTCVLREDLKNNTIIVKYAKSSSMLLSVVPRIARYLTGKDFIAYPRNCFLGNTDWYLSRNNNCSGILQEIKNSTLNFNNGDCDSLQNLFNTYSHNLACIVMEPYRAKIFKQEFYTLLSELCIKNNVLLVFDETVTGYRFYYPLAQYRVACTADLTILGKAFANGYALSAVIGSKNIMQKIALATINDNLFGFSTTHAGESVGLAASIETLKIYNTKQVIDQLELKGQYLMTRMHNALSQSSLNKFCNIEGQPAYFKLHSQYPKLLADITSFFYKKRILFKGTMAVSLSHTQEHLDIICANFSKYCKSFDSIEFINSQT